MVQIVKKEWHQVSSEYVLDFTTALLGEIYPDKDDDELIEILKQIESGDIDIEEVLDEAINNNIDVEWDHTYDDWWTSRKGGFDITYEVGNE